MAMEITQVLLNAQAVDDTIRKHAEAVLKQFQEQNLPSFLLSLAVELADDDKPIESRELAGLQLKNAVDAKDQHMKLELVHRWLPLDTFSKSQIKTCLLNTRSSPACEARSTASQIIPKVARIELLVNKWPELISTLFAYTQRQLPAPTKQALLDTLGNICFEVAPYVFNQDDTNKILTAIFHGMSSFEGGTDIRLASIQALYHALCFAKVKFANDMERDYIMRVVCEATLSSELKLRQAAFDCLIVISTLFYYKLSPYINSIFNFTLKAVREDEDSVVFQAIEVWSSICKREIDILETYGDGGDFDGDSDVHCFYFIKKTLPRIVCMLLETLIKQEEDHDQDKRAWNIAMAGSTCLELVAQAVGDDVISLVVPFVEDNLTKPDWRKRVAATYAFCSIMEGPSPTKLIDFVNVFLNYMLGALMNDPNTRVKETLAWLLGKMFGFLHRSTLQSSTITQANYQQIVTALLQNMYDVPNVAKKACHAVYVLAQGNNDVGPSSSPLTPFFHDIIQALFNVTRQEDAGESSLQISAYNTINEVGRCSTEETAPMMTHLIHLIMMELHQIREALNLSTDELQEHMCSCLQVIIRKLQSFESTKPVLRQNADQMMNLFLGIFACQRPTARKESMQAIAALVHAIGPAFENYMPIFCKYLEMNLQNVEDYKVCLTAVDLVMDICRTLDSKILPYCEWLMTQLLYILSSNQFPQFMNPLICSCFGDIALAIRENFDKYLVYTFPALQNAAELLVNAFGRDDDVIIFLTFLRNGILKAYSGILGAFKGSPKSQLLMPHARNIIWFVGYLSMERAMYDLVMKSSIVVLRDLAETLGSDVVPLIQESVQKTYFLPKCLISDDDFIKESAERIKFVNSRAIRK